MDGSNFRPSPSPSPTLPGQVGSEPEAAQSPGPASPVAPQSPPGTPLGERLQGWDRAASPRRLSTGDDASATAQSSEWDDEDDLDDGRPLGPGIFERSSPIDLLELGLAQPLPAPSRGDLSTHPHKFRDPVQQSARTALSFAVRRPSLSPEVRAALLRSSTVANLLERIHRALAQPCSDSKLSQGQRIGHLAEREVASIIQELQVPHPPSEHPPPPMQNVKD